jgi:hypothetical protein
MMVWHERTNLKLPQCNNWLDRETNKHSQRSFTCSPGTGSAREGVSTNSFYRVGASFNSPVEPNLRCTVSRLDRNEGAA